MKKAVIIGGGISGLNCANHLADVYSVDVIEKEKKVGGMCASFKDADVILDYGPHKLYSQIPGIMPRFKTILGTSCITVKKRNSLRILGKYISFPLQITNLIKAISPKTVSAGIKVGFSYLYSLIKGLFFKKKNVTYKDYFVNGFGKHGYRILFKDLASKVWGDPENLSEELGRKRVPVPSIAELMKGFFTGSKKKVSAEYFYYPKFGIGTVCGNLAKEIKETGGTIHLNSDVQKISIKDNKVISVTLADNKEINSDMLVTTIPLQETVALMDPKPPKDVIDAAKNLMYRNLIILYLTVDKNQVMKDIWRFFLDKEVIFNRVSEQKNFSEFTVPRGKTVLMVEITVTGNNQVWKYDDKKLLRIVERDLRKVDLLRNISVSKCIVRRFTRVYPVLDIHYRRRLDKVLDYINSISNMYTVGRHGMFNYNNMDHCIDMTDRLAAHIKSAEPKERWVKQRTYFDDYRIVD